MKYEDSSIEHFKRLLNRAQGQFLQENGWIHSSANPASIWLWHRQGFSLPTDLAVDMQLAMEKNK